MKMGRNARGLGAARLMLAGAALAGVGSVAEAGSIGSISIAAPPNNIMMVFPSGTDQFSASPSGTFSFSGTAGVVGTFSISGGSYNTSSSTANATLAFTNAMSLPDAKSHTLSGATLDVLDLSAYASAKQVKMLFTEGAGGPDPLGTKVLVFLDTRLGVGNAEIVAVPAPAAAAGGAGLFAGLGLVGAVRRLKKRVAQ